MDPTVQAALIGGAIALFGSVLNVIVSQLTLQRERQHQERREDRHRAFDARIGAYSEFVAAALRCRGRAMLAIALRQRNAEVPKEIYNDLDEAHNELDQALGKIRLLASEPVRAAGEDLQEHVRALGVFMNDPRWPSTSQGIEKTLSDLQQRRHAFERAVYRELGPIIVAADEGASTEMPTVDPTKNPTG